MPTRPDTHPLGRFLAKLAAPALAPMSDGELLAHYRGGSEPAFGLLVARHGDMARAAALRVLGNASDADDATQVAFALLAENAARLTESRSVGGWLHGVARKVALQLRRRQRRMARRERRAARPEAVQPADAVERAELLAALDAALARLPERLREALVLCELEGVSRQATAERLGIPVGTLSSRLASAHKQLARRLGTAGLGAALAALLAPSSGASLPPAVVWVAGVGPTAKLLLWEVKRMALFVKLKLVAASVAVTAGAVGVTAGAGGLAGVGGAPGAAAVAHEPAPRATEKAASVEAPRPICLQGQRCSACHESAPGVPEVKLSPEAEELQILDKEARFKRDLVGLWQRTSVKTASSKPVPPAMTLIERVDVLETAADPVATLVFAVVTAGETRLMERTLNFVVYGPSSSAKAWPPLTEFYAQESVAGGRGGVKFTATSELLGDELKLALPLYRGLDTLFPSPEFFESRDRLGNTNKFSANAPVYPVAETYVLTFRRQPQPKPAPAPTTLSPKAPLAAPSALYQRVAELKRERVELLKGYHAAVAGQAGPAPADTEPAAARSYDRERYQALLKADWLALELELAATPAEQLTKRQEVVGAMREAEQIDVEYLKRLRGFSPKKQEVLARAIDLTRRRTEAEIEYERLKAGRP